MPGLTIPQHIVLTVFLLLVLAIKVLVVRYLFVKIRDRARKQRDNDR